MYCHPPLFLEQMIVYYRLSLVLVKFVTLFFLMVTKLHFTLGLPYLKCVVRRRGQGGGGIGWGDHFLSYKFIKRITERRANF